MRGAGKPRCATQQEQLVARSRRACVLMRREPGSRLTRATTAVAERGTLQFSACGESGFLRRNRADSRPRAAVAPPWRHHSLPPRPHPARTAAARLYTAQDHPAQLSDKPDPPVAAKPAVDSSPTSRPRWRQQPYAPLSSTRTPSYSTRIGTQQRRERARRPRRAAVSLHLLLVSPRRQTNGAGSAQQRISACSTSSRSSLSSASSGTSTSTSCGACALSTSPSVPFRLSPFALVPPLTFRPRATQFYTLLRAPRHYRDISIPHLPHLDPHLVAFLPSVLGGTRHLSLRSFPSSLLSALLPACSSRLTTLDLSFSGVRDADLVVLASAAGHDEPGSTTSRRATGALQSLRTLRVKGCRRLSTFLGQLCPRDDCAGEPVLPFLETLDLSWSSLSLLPLPLSTHLPRLVDLNLSTTPYLALPHLADALVDLPPRLAVLDLSHLGLCARDLRGLGTAADDPQLDVEYVVPIGAARHSPARSSPTSGADARAPSHLSSPARPALHLVLSGNDALTHQSLAALRHHWAAPHSQWAGRRPVEVEHSPVLLESDDEDDVRRFVEMVAGVVMRGGVERE